MPRSKVVHLSSVHPPFDTRIFYKECVSLAQAGYVVVLVIPHERNETINGVHLRAIPKPTNRKKRMTKTIWQVYRKALLEAGDLYHFHDPELIPVGFLLKMRGKKVVYDIHEDVPVQILGKDYMGGRWKRKLAALSVQGVEGLAGKLFDGIVGTIPEITAKFPEHKAVTLRNYPIVSMIDAIPPHPGIEKRRPVMIYAGGLTAIRGIRELIQAASLLEDRVELWLVGNWANDDFRKECEALDGWRNTRYLGYVTPDEVYGYLKLADIGLVTLYPQTNYLTSLPVKAFEYMACSLPMVMSDFDYWRNVYEGAAAFVNPQDPQVIASAIRHLLDNPDEMVALGKTGRQMVESSYSWEKESENLLSFYTHILRS